MANSGGPHANRQFQGLQSSPLHPQEGSLIGPRPRVAMRRARRRPSPITHTVPPGSRRRVQHPLRRTISSTKTSERQFDPFTRCSSALPVEPSSARDLTRVQRLLPRRPICAAMGRDDGSGRASRHFVVCDGGTCVLQQTTAAALGMCGLTGCRNDRTSSLSDQDRNRRC
jgi:hypothetical protein